VYDPTGAVITNAEIIIINESTAEMIKLYTNNEGKYFALLPPTGLYSIKVASPGFQEHCQTNIKVSDRMQQLDAILQIPATSEVIIVSSSRKRAKVGSRKGSR
jgi:hypothetical protein